MDRSTKKRLVLSFLSSSFGRLSSTLIVLVQYPVFLHYWSVPLFGDWLIVAGIPTYLSFSATGFGSVAGNEMTMMVARDDRSGALRVFQSCWWFIVLLCSTVVLLLSGALYYLPAARLLRISQISDTDTKWIIFYLGVSVLLGQLEQLLQSAYRSIGRYPFGSLVKSVMSLTAFTLTLAAVASCCGPRTVALVYAAANIAGTLFLCLLVKHDIPWIEFGWRHASIAQSARSPSRHRLYGLPRRQRAEPLRHPARGQLRPRTHQRGGLRRRAHCLARRAADGPARQQHLRAGDVHGLRRGQHPTHPHPPPQGLPGCLDRRRGAGCGRDDHRPVVPGHWTSGHVPPSRGLLGILLLVVVLFSLWSTSSALMTSTNQHQRMAAIYLAATSLTCVACYFLAQWKGLYGAAAGLLLSELAMNAYVLPASLRIAHDTFPAFMAGMLSYPPSLKPGALWARLRRAKPHIEEQELR